MVVPVSILMFISVCCSRSSASASDCGVRGSSTQGPSAQIVGGEDAAPLEFPWQAFVQRSDAIFCGGSVINKEYIITAARCTKPNLTVSDYTVTVEKYHSDQQDPNERTYAISEVTTHPKWVRATLEYDYALLKLETSLDFSGVDKNVMPICLPEKDQTFENQTCTAIGWGTTLNTQGDSGGPLQCPRADGHYVLAGITSFDTICGAPDHPSVFSRVATQVDWIQSVTGETP